MTGDGSARYPGDDYVLPFGRASIVREGGDLTMVSWGAMVHRCTAAAAAFGDRVEADRLAHDRAVGSRGRAGIRAQRRTAA